MASRRMVSLKIVSSARFLKMPPSTQNLYFHLIVNADDDGIVEGFTIMRLVGSTEDDLKILAAKGFVSVLNEDLVTFVNDWLEHNKIRSDRKIDSIYKDLLIKIIPDIEIREPKKVDNVSQTSDKCQTNVGIGKDRIGKVSKGKDNNNIDQSSSKEADKVSLKNSFESIWKLYPKKMGKDGAFKAYQKAIKDGVTDEQIIKGIEDYKKQIELQRTEIQFVKQGSSFFHQRAYLDEYVTQSKKTNERRGYEREVDIDW